MTQYVSPSWLSPSWRLTKTVTLFDNICNNFAHITLDSVPSGWLADLLASAESNLRVRAVLIIQSSDADKCYILYMASSGVLVAHSLATSAMHLYNDVVTSSEVVVEIPDVLASPYVADPVVACFDAVRCMTAVPLRYQHNSVGMMCAIAGETNVKIGPDVMLSITGTITDRMQDPGLVAIERQSPRSQRRTTRLFEIYQHDKPPNEEAGVHRVDPSQCHCCTACFDSEML